LLIAVIAEVSVVSAIAGRATLFVLYRPVSSADICCASPALPPFPKSSILLPLFRASIIAVLASFIVGI